LIKRKPPGGKESRRKRVSRFTRWADLEREDPSFISEEINFSTPFLEIAEKLPHRNREQEGKRGLSHRPPSVEQTASDPVKGANASSSIRRK